VYCRNCGVQLRRILGQWWHVQRLGPVPCPGAEPEDPGPTSEEMRRAERESEAEAEERRRDP